MSHEDVLNNNVKCDGWVTNFLDAANIALRFKYVVSGIEDAYGQFNPLTGEYFVYGQKGSNTPYIVENKAEMSKMIQRISHWNQTGEAKNFKKMPVTIKKI